MIDTKPKVTAFLRENFTTATPESATHKLSSEELLSMLFNVFPEGSIDTYDLYDILSSLNYKPYKITSQSEKKETMEFLWCLKEMSNSKV